MSKAKTVPPPPTTTTIRTPTTDPSKTPAIESPRRSEGLRQPDRLLTAQVRRQVPDDTVGINLLSKQQR